MLVYDCCTRNWNSPEVSVCIGGSETTHSLASGTRSISTTTTEYAVEENLLPSVDRLNACSVRSSSASQSALPTLRNHNPAAPISREAASIYLLQHQLRIIVVSANMRQRLRAHLSAHGNGRRFRFINLQRCRRRVCHPEHLMPVLLIFFRADIVAVTVLASAS